MARWPGCRSLLGMRIDVIDIWILYDGGNFEMMSMYSN